MIRLVTFDPLHFEAGEEIGVETTLLAEPKVRGTTQYFWVDGKILVVTSRFPEFHYADPIFITGTLGERLTDKKQTILTAYFPKIELRENKRSPFLSLTRFIRQHIIANVSGVLPHTPSSLLLGILLGVKENLPADFSQALRLTGTLHVVAASGMNVTIVGGILFSLTSRFLRRQISLVVCLVGIVLYAAIAGFEASIMRASIMGALAFTAQIVGRQVLSLYTLILVGIVMLLFDPNLLFDLGFQLSFLATGGLLTLKPLFDAREIPPLASVLKDSLTTTLSAQLTTLPIILANFGLFSIFSILANTLVLWTVGEIMIIGGLGAVLSFIFPPLAHLFILATLPFLLFFEAGVTFFARMPGQIVIGEFPLILGIGYYFLLISIYLLVKKI